jgi:hypothetical protein
LKDRKEFYHPYLYYGLLSKAKNSNAKIFLRTIILWLKFPFKIYIFAQFNYIVPMDPKSFEFRN